MAVSKRSRREFEGKVIDVHAHVGVSLGMYARGEYPYAQTLEGLAYRMRAGKVDAAVCFPFTPDLYFNYDGVVRGELVPADAALSPAPYAAENRCLMREVFEDCPELSDRFLPLVCVDPGRTVDAQLEKLAELVGEFPIYGVKVNPVLCQSPVAGLLGVGAPLLDFAEERGLPVLFHTNPFGTDAYSDTADVFRIIERRPRLRFCLAHCLLFHRESLERAAAAENVWVDTAAMKIQVALLADLFESEARREDCIDADYDDYRAVLGTLCEAYPDTMIWGTDSPAYAYRCRRKQREGTYAEFRYKATYEDEVAARDGLSEDLRRKVSTVNTLDFIFGPDT
jgi:predicted TIM-barrel fold metal-dependent hydrolase